jgi:hypothetical protein
MRSSEATLNLITELVEDKGGEFTLWFDEDVKVFVARMDFEDGSGSYSGTSIICGEAINGMIDRVQEGEVSK